METLCLHDFCLSGRQLRSVATGPRSLVGMADL